MVQRAARRVHAPGEGLTASWVNRNRQINTPFIVGAASAMILPANPLRTYLLIQNKNAVSNMFVNFGSEATAFNGIIIIPLGNYELIGGAYGAYCPSESVHILGAAANLNGVATVGLLPPTTPRLY